jgi:hypothetical protein
MADTAVYVHMSGPIFEGRAPLMTEQMTASAVAEVADYAKFEVLMQLHEVLQHPTGHYESQITDQPISPTLHRIHDNQVIYGPWLEGVGSRNYPVTRFKGYHTFRIVKNRMRAKAQAIIEAHVARVVAEL